MCTPTLRVLVWRWSQHDYDFGKSIASYRNSTLVTHLYVVCTTTTFMLQIISLVLYSNALEAQNETEREINNILQKYIDKIPDIDSKYVINEGLSKSISRYFKGKMSAFPLFKISLKIDRTPVKIPWTIDGHGEQVPTSVDGVANNGEIQYKFLKPKKVHSPKNDA